MDVIKFLQSGVKVSNPNYNPKTKKGRLEPPTLTSYNPDSDNRVQGRNVLFNRMTGQSYNLSQYDPDKYADYNVYINPVQSQEKLDRERAVNQSNWEQGLRSVGQTLNQALTGTAVGIADAVDAVYNWFTNQPQDYQSDVAASLESVKESIDERLAIYRENPNAAFDVTDFAWWASNVPTIASSISLMAPGIGITKGISFLGKATKLSKVANKIADAANISNKARAVTSRLGESISTGVTMRYLENYQEARQTYNDVYEMAKYNLANMNNKQRAEFLKNNPQYEGMKDYEIAANIAENSADTTFWMDWANVFFDVAQVYTIGNLWKNALSGQTTSKLTRLNRAAATNFGKDAAAITESLASKTFKDKAITNIKDLGRDIVKGVRAEWTEGIEEAVNYISSQEGLYAGKKVFDKNTKRNTLNDYLSDAHLWEQAFWGAIGGVVFSGAMNKVGEFANRKLDKDWVKSEEQKEAEILGRSVLTDVFKQNLDAIKEGKNPFDNNSPIISGTESTVREMAVQEYVDNLVINALNAGNGQLLKDFASDNNIIKGIQEKLGIDQVEAKSLQSSLINSIDRVEGVYNDVMNKVNLLGGDFNIGRIIASKVARGKISKELAEKNQNWAQTQLNNDVHKDGIDITDLEVQDALQQVYRNTAESIKNEIENIKASAEIDEKVKVEMINASNEKLASVERLILPVEDETLLANQQAALNKIAKDYSEITTDLANLAGANIRLNTADNYINLSDSYIRKQIKEYNLLFNQATKKIVKGAYDDMYKMTEKYGAEIVQEVAIEKKDNDNVDSIDAKIMRKAYNVLKLNSPTDKYLENTINDIVNNINRKKESKEVVESGVPENPFENIEDVVEEEVTEEESETIPSPTGGQEKSSSEGATIAAESATPTEQPTIVEQAEQTAQQEEVKSQPAPVVATQKFADTLPEDEWERGKAINDELFRQMVNRQDIDENNNDSIIAAEQSFIDYLVSQGIGTIEATQEVNNFVNAFRYSAIAGKPTHRMMVNANKAMFTGNALNAEAVIEEYIKSLDSENNLRSKTINGVTYFNLGQLLEFVLSEANNNKLIKDYLFAPLKSYIYSQANNGKYVLTDGDIVSGLDDKSAAQYIDELTKARIDRLKGRKENNVNVEFLENEDNFNNFTTLKPDDELTPVVDSQKGRIILTANGLDVGYMGIPNYRSDGSYQRYNMSWNYELFEDRGIIVSALKDFFNDIIEGDRANDEFLSMLYELASLDKAVLTEDMLIPLYDKMIELYPDAETFINTKEDKYKSRAAFHLVSLTKYAVNSGYSFTRSINNWFADLLNSYDQAKSIVDGKFDAKVKISSISYGLLNTDDASAFEGNNIESAVANYDETKHELGIVITDKASGLNKTYTSHGSVNGQAPIGSLKTGVVIIKVPKADGTFAYAHCTQPTFSSGGFTKDGEFIQQAIIDEFTNLVDDFLNNRINFTEFQSAINDMIGNDSLITGIFAVNPKKKQTTRQFYVSQGKNQDTKTYFNVNDALGKYTRNVVFSDSTGKTHIVKSTSDSRFTSMVKPLIEEYIRNAKFAVGKSFIGDSNYDNRNTNRYIKRINGKTVIKFRDKEFTFNSYQDFLVKTNGVRTKLLGRKSNNFVYNPFVTKLNIVYEIESVKDSTPRRGVTEESQSILYSTVSADNISSLTAAINNNVVSKAFRTYFNNDKTALEYVAALQKINMLPKNIQIDNTLVDSNGNPVFGAYNEASDTMRINLKAFEGYEHHEVIRTAVHERVHQVLTNHYDKEKLLKNLGEVYDEFIDWYNNEASAQEKITFKDFLYEGRSREYKVEEFIVESMTMPFFMEKLNEIKTKTPIKGQKKQTLLNKLLNIIANLFGIKINEDSLLAKANAYYSQASIKKTVKPVSKNVEAVQGSLEFKEETETKEEVSTEVKEEKPVKKKSNRRTIIDEDFDSLSAISQFKYRNLSAIIESVPMERQAEFGRLLDTGTISFACV